MITSTRLAIGIPLLLISGIGVQHMLGSKITGNTLAADLISDSSSFVSLRPVDTPDGSAYTVYWQGCTLHPDYNHRYCLTASGLAPKSAVRSQQDDSLQVTLDIADLSVLYYKQGIDCRSGTCITFVPLSVPLSGVFTIYRGPGSSVEEFHGNSRLEYVWSSGLLKFFESFIGTKITYTANFAGTVGPRLVTPPPTGFNSTLAFMRGQQTSQTVYPRTP